jgi:hypothetical protein
MAALASVDRTLLVGMLRQGKTGEQLLNILNVISADSQSPVTETVEAPVQEVSEVSETEEVESVLDGYTEESEAELYTEVI